MWQALRLPSVRVMEDRSVRTVVEAVYAHNDAFPVHQSCPEAERKGRSGGYDGDVTGDRQPGFPDAIECAPPGRFIGEYDGCRTGWSVSSSPTALALSSSSNTTLSYPSAVRAVSVTPVGSVVAGNSLRLDSPTQSPLSNVCWVSRVPMPGD